MVEIENDETVVVGLLAAYSHTVSTTPRGNVCRIDSHIDLSILDVVQAGALGLRLGNVVDIAIGRIVVLESDVLVLSLSTTTREILTVKKSTMSAKDSAG